MLEKADGAIDFSQAPDLVAAMQRLRAEMSSTVFRRKVAISSADRAGYWGAVAAGLHRMLYPEPPVESLASGEIPAPSVE